MSLLNSERWLTQYSIYELLDLPEMVELRRKYAALSAEERKRAAEWEYARDEAELMFSQFADEDKGSSGHLYADGAVLALVMEPGFAPAIMTVASVEYQLGRVDDAISLLLTLCELPEDTKDLSTIIDQAANFLIDQEDLSNAERLYAVAARVFPEEPCYHAGLGYCAGKTNRKGEAVAHLRRAASLSPDDPGVLNDLGWSLIEAGEYDEAEEILIRTVILDADNTTRGEANLDYLRKTRSASSGRKSND